MTARLVICPVLVAANGSREPKVGTIADPGKPGAEYVYSAIISNGQPGEQNDFCLALVGGIDLANLDADSEIISLFEMPDDMLGTIQETLQKTPVALGWKQNVVNRLSIRFQSQGANSFDLNKNTPLWQWANRIGLRFNSSADVRELMTTRQGA